MALLEQYKETVSFLESYLKKKIGQMKRRLSGTNLKDKIVPVIYEEDGKIIAGVEMPEYGIWVDSGRGPGKQPPQKVLENWLTSKDIKFRNKKGQFLKNKTAAFLVARNIGRYGIEARPFLDLLYKDDFKDIDEAFAEDVSNLFVLYLNKEGLNVKEN